MSDLSPATLGPAATSAPRVRTVPPVVLIYNRTSGTSAQGGGIVPRLPGIGETSDATPVWIEEARHFLRVEIGTDPEIIATESEEQAKQVLREVVQKNTPLVIAAGGDGTLRTAANILSGTDTVLGIVPKGTVNVFARELSIPLDDTLAALQIALHGRTRRIDVGCVYVPDRKDGQLFLLMASLGFDATAVENVNKDVKDVVGASAYVLAGLSTFGNFVPPSVTLNVYGSDKVSGVPIERTSDAFAILIANTSLYGGDFRAAPDAELDDGLLDVLVFDAAPGLPTPLQRANFAKQFGLAALGQHLSDPNVHHIQASKMEISCHPATSLQVDGDPFGAQSVFQVEVLPRSLAVRS